MSEQNILEIRNLSVEYNTDDGVVKAVNGVSLELRKGETLGLVGETGAGKTTIAKSILRTLPEETARVTGGEILFEGNELLKLSEREMRRLRGHSIAMIFQDPMSALNPVYTVGSQITEGIRLHQHLNKVEAVRKAGDMLEMVGIPRSRYGNYPNEFSGGMKQRAIIAIALACNPELLLADEPTTALDVTIQAQVLDLMEDLKEQLGTSVIMITHDFGVVAEVCSRVAVIYAGQVMEYGTRKDIFLETRHPYTIGLFDSLPKLDRKEKRLHTIPGLMPNPMALPPGCPFWPRCRRATEECRKNRIIPTEVSPGHMVSCLHFEGKGEGA